jgi:hypothetical protein
MAETTVPIDKRHRVLIAATVAAVYGNNARVLGIVPAAADVRGSWARAGREAIHNSHQPSGQAGTARLLEKKNPGALWK